MTLVRKSVSLGAWVVSPLGMPSALGFHPAMNGDVSLALTVVGWNTLPDDEQAERAVPTAVVATCVLCHRPKVYSHTSLG